MDLLPALALTAVGVLAAVAAHAGWAARRASPRQADPPSAGPEPGSADAPAPRAGDDPTLVAAPAVGSGAGPDPRAGGDPARSASSLGERIEPSLGLLEPAGAAPGLAGASGLAAASGVAGAGSAGGAVAARIAPRLDALIDAMVTLTVEAPVSGELAIANLPASWRAGRKPLHIEGLELTTGLWEQPAHGRRYSEFQAGVQLANRSGALTSIEYSEFVQKVQDFADGVGAMAQLPDMLEVMARARELDAFARPLDAELSVQLRARNAAWSVGYLLQCASRRGLVPGGRPGRWVMPGAAEGDPPVLSFNFDAQAALDEAAVASALRQVQLTLEVAHTPREAEPFPAWHRLATELAAEMDAQIVDDEDRPLSLVAFDQIGRELQRLYDELESRDLAAGTAAARRLFSG